MLRKQFRVGAAVFKVLKMNVRLGAAVNWPVCGSAPISYTIQAVDIQSAKVFENGLANANLGLV